MFDSNLLPRDWGNPIKKVETAATGFFSEIENASSSAFKGSENAVSSAVKPIVDEYNKKFPPTHTVKLDDNQEPAQAPTQVPVSQAPTNVEQFNVGDIHSYTNTIQNSIKNTGNKVDEAYAKALIHMESSIGGNRKNEFNDYGKYGYLVGFTKIASDELKRLGIDFNTDTPEGAMDAAIKYSSAKGKGETDMVKLYDEVYKTKAGANSKSQFEKLYNYYKSQQ